MKVDIKKYSEDIYQIDVLMEGKSSRMACYYIDSKEPVLIEVGPSNSFPYLIAGLDSIGISSVKKTVITHLHIDHVGGIGHVVDKYKDSYVYIHELGLKHLPNPEKLWKAVSTIYGEEWLKKYWGEMLPVPERNIVSLNDVDYINLDAGRKLNSIYSPGHAKHHYTFYDTSSGTLFMGDALGLIYPHGHLVQPNLPPPDFNKEIMFKTFEKLMRLDIEQLAIAHFGIHKKPYELMEQAMQSIDDWINFCKNIDDLSSADASIKLMNWVKSNYEKLGMDDETVNNYVKQGNFAMQISGIVNYLKTN